MSKRSKASRFPAARIKKIMQMDEDVGKLASATPVMISKSLECFMQLLLDETAKEARSRGSKKLTAYHLKHTINNTPSFDFLLDIVSKVPDPTHAEAAEGAAAGSSNAVGGPSRRKPSSSGAGGPQPPPKSRRKKSAAVVTPIVAAPLGYADDDERERKPYAGHLDMEDRDMDYSGRPTVRPGIGNLLNPSEDASGPVKGGMGGYGSGDGGGEELKDEKEPEVGQGEGGRGMFDDYEDDDDY